MGVKPKQPDDCQKRPVKPSRRRRRLAGKRVVAKPALVQAPIEALEFRRLFSAAAMDNACCIGGMEADAGIPEVGAIVVSIHVPRGIKDIKSNQKE